MRHPHLIAALLVICLAGSACKKTHSCRCNVTTEVVQIFTPRNGSPSSSGTNTKYEDRVTTFNHVKKKDVSRLMECNSRSTYNTRYLLINNSSTGLNDVTETTTVQYECTVH